MYKLRMSRREKKKLLRIKWVLVAIILISAALVIWLAWVRPIRQDANIQPQDNCIPVGNEVGHSQHEVCPDKSGRRLATSSQKTGQEDTRQELDEITPPSDPEQLRLDIDEWGVSIPLTNETFDLSYYYLDTGNNQSVRFTYKRLLKVAACEKTIGLTLTRSSVKNKPPYTESRPKPIAQANGQYFYVKYDDELCYDKDNADHAALVKKITGDKTLPQTTADLLTEMADAPED